MNFNGSYYVSMNLIFQFLGRFASFIGMDDILTIQSEPLMNNRVLYFMRSTVLASDFLYVCITSYFNFNRWPSVDGYSSCLICDEWNTIHKLSIYSSFYSYNVYSTGQYPFPGMVKSNGILIMILHHFIFSTMQC